MDALLADDIKQNEAASTGDQKSNQLQKENPEVSKNEKKKAVIAGTSIRITNLDENMEAKQENKTIENLGGLGVFTKASNNSLK